MSNDESGLDPNQESKYWVPDDALNALVTERTLNPQENDEAIARRLLTENVGVAVQGIIHVAMHGVNERTRLDASKYIIERVLGKVGDDAYGKAVSPIDTLMDDITKNVEAYANGETGS